MKKIQSGFTLIELMVTITVAAILLAIGVPSLTSLYEGIRARSVISTIESSFVFARSQAVSYGSRVSICPMTTTSCGSDWTKGFSVFIDNGTLGSMDTTNGIADVVLRKVDAFNSNDFIKSDLSRYSFNPDGMGTNGGSSVFRYCPGKVTSSSSEALNINSSGRISKVTTTVACS
ncbi:MULTISPECIES: GspH/FimT family pseudopilin [Shewanella]|uniref:Type II secretion system protein H n=1 Tax=Shewanella psychromarinicola TaxID=2487742 RepID=A0A3N4E7Y5_9GAMM|nr:GspH/FimT family pseudopilin [Shewanella psychromarinicola]AZG35314.1 prepilin-type N-terminal cleavage/methylation domain-containing protein [Shewanella psychromarinicola]MCL1081581.1 GspH/FimT family pseudopilin [Shewanella psychromarinicola]RPA32882.1 prepilin-type N-terminal cleavage/methylation domain-containing protein [Shewanella psychromarinicola]